MRSREIRHFFFNHINSMKILIASCGHKDFLSPLEACQAIAGGLDSLSSNHSIEVAPMADGGDGTIDALITIKRGEIVTVETHDSLFRLRDAKMGICADKKTAVIEIAEAAGSAILEPYERQTMIATSFGVGELILAAVRFGCNRIVIGLGGSVVSDCGIGMAQALGAVFLDKRGNRLAPIANGGFNALSLTSIDDIAFDDLKVNFDGLEIHVASDVAIPLLGSSGQARMFGPQKGANSIEIKYLEQGFSNLVEIFRQRFSKDINVPLAGAAGGLGAGLLGFLNAKLYLGAQFIAEEMGLAGKISHADIVIVGEGCLDKTTLCNKGPYYIANLAHTNKKKVIAVVGQQYKSADLLSLYNHISCCCDFYDNEILTAIKIKDSLKKATRKAMEELFSQEQ